MSKKVYVWLVLAAIILVTTGSVLYFSNHDRSLKYFVIDEGLYQGDKRYIRQTNNLAAINLGKQIGVTDEKQQVYEITGLDSDSWICSRTDGIESVFRETKTPYLIPEKFKANKLLIKDEGALGGKQVIISQKDIIERILSDMKDENLVKTPDTEQISSIKQVNLYSEDYPGIYFILYLLHDESNGYCFLLESGTQTTWKIGHELMKQIM
ncbi:hypothetical protein [Paenibacillus monticola]|uniref:DUF4340 domain-containing protein n=1 Tax=Paenibacillus monticola TaxID=2666075 RepID=A0A7X2L4H6_9BACL|nr:hypothetical protein [Paenibacillus monticola]MRN56333.1 hypothetical protein [Paenibacillus monticola]